MISKTIRNGARACITALAACILMAGCGGGDGNDGAPRFETATFAAPQSDLLEKTPFNLPLPATTFSNQTVRQVAHVSVGGEALKLKFSNQYGTEPLVLDKVHVARSLGRGAIDPATDRRVMFSGNESVTIPPGEERYSDVVELTFPALSDLAVSAFIKDADVRTARRYSTTTTYIGLGDLTASPGMPGATEVASLFYLSQVVAIRDTKANVVVAVGDSITESSSLKDTYNSWPEQLAKIANAKFDVAVLNAGIGGNRWVKDNFGPCAVCRLERDVLSVPGVTHAMFALGVNDLGLGYFYTNAFQDASQLVTADDIKHAIQQTIDRMKARGIKVFIATIVPYKGVYYYTSGQPSEIPYGSTTPYNGEAIRQEVNDFIRNNPTVDGVLDFDAAIRSTADPLVQNPTLTSEGLHPNDVGLATFAKLVDLEKLR